MKPEEDYSDYLDRIEKESKAELLEYAPKVRDFLLTDLGEYMVKTIQLIIDTHTQNGDVIQSSNPLRCYDAARGARDVLDTLKSLAEWENDTTV